MEFISRMLVYVGFIVFAVIFYTNIDHMPVEATTMPMLGIIAVIGLALLLLVSDLVRTVKGRSLSAVTVPLTDQLGSEADADPAAEGSDDPSAPSAVRREPAVEREEGERAGTDEEADEAAAAAARTAGPPPPEFGGDQLETPRVLNQALPAAILVGAYIYFLPIIGFIVGSVIFMAALAVLLGARSVVRVAIYAVVFPFGFQWLFENLLQLRLP